MSSLPLKIAKALTFIGLLGATIACFGILFLAIVSFLSPNGTPVKNATWEIPLKIESELHPEKITHSDNAFIATKVEYDRVELEMLPTKNKSLTQGMIYLTGFGFSVISFLILFNLFQVLANLDTQTFIRENVQRVRRIGLLAIGFELYRFSLSLLLSLTIGPKIDIQGAEVVAIGWTNLDFNIIFLGIIILVIAEVFKQGYVLQEYENLTV